MTCDATQQRLPAYGDNELSVETALEVEQHLRGCLQCRARLEQQHRFAHAVGQLYPRAALPPGLEERIRRRLRPTPRRSWMTTLALAASLLLGLAMLWSLTRRGAPTAPAPVVAAAQVHRSALAHASTLAMQSSDTAAVNAWLRTALPFEVGEPLRRVTAGLSLQGAAVLDLAGERVGYVQYRRGEHVISLFLLRPREWPADVELVRVRNMDFHLYSVDGAKLIAWNHLPLSYILISDLAGLSTRGAPACAICHGGAADGTQQSFTADGLI